MEQSTGAASEVIRQAAYLRIAGVESGAAVEAPSCHFSTDSEKRGRQRRRLWSDGTGGLVDRGVSVEPGSVSGVSVLPYRRRLFTLTTNPDLRRIIEVIDRERLGILECLLSSGVDASLSGEGGRSLGRQLLDAIVGYDFPTIATLVRGDGDTRQILSDTLGMTGVDLARMESLAGDEWDGLGEGDERFGKYDANRRRA